MSSSKLGPNTWIICGKDTVLRRHDVRLMGDPGWKPKSARHLPQHAGRVRQTLANHSAQERREC